MLVFRKKKTFYTNTCNIRQMTRVYLHLSKNIFTCNSPASCSWLIALLKWTYFLYERLISHAFIHVFHVKWFIQSLVYVYSPQNIHSCKLLYPSSSSPPSTFILLSHPSSFRLPFPFLKMSDESPVLVHTEWQLKEWWTHITCLECQGVNDEWWMFMFDLINIFSHSDKKSSQPVSLNWWINFKY